MKPRRIAQTIYRIIANSLSSLSPSVSHVSFIDCATSRMFFAEPNPGVHSEVFSVQILLFQLEWPEYVSCTFLYPQALSAFHLSDQLA